MKEAKVGTAVRLECNGVQFLRTVCRLTHNGAQQYAKVSYEPYPICPPATLYLSLTTTNLNFPTG
jgi:hypothetical protein